MNITELRRMNIPLKTIQKRVGHAIDSDVTDKHYVHAIDADDRMAADRIGALLGPKGRSSLNSLRRAVALK
jgi:hypothetical protein